MLEVNCLLQYKGKTSGVILKDLETCKEKCYTLEYLRHNLTSYEYTNAIHDSKGYFRGKNGITLPTKEILMPLYHGSHCGIKGNIKHNVGRNICDFGTGFYVGDTLEQAKQLIVEDKNGKIYKIGIDLNGLKVYKFEKTLESSFLWACYIGVHRKLLNIKKYPKLEKILKNIDKHDLIIGLIADDKMHQIYPDFMVGNITDKVLIECLKLVKYGNQYVCKTEKACNQIYIFDYPSKLTDAEKNKLRNHKKVVLNGINNQVQNIKKDYRRQGKFIDELLEDYE